MHSLALQSRVGRAVLAATLALSMVIASAGPGFADEKLGETAIDATMGSLSGADDPAAPPPAEAPATDSGTADAPAEGDATTETAPVDDSGELAAEPATADIAAADSTADVGSGTGNTDATTEAPADAAATSDGDGSIAPATDESAASGDDVSAAQSIDPTADSGANNDAQSSGRTNRGNGNRDTTHSSAQRANEDGIRTDVGENTLAQTAMRNVLVGEPVLSGTILPAAASNDTGSAGAGGANAAPIAGSRPGAGVRAAGESIAPAAFAPSNRRGSGEREPDNGTVVVNSLMDSGDQGKLAVHGDIVAGTLCDGSQFWSLDGGGTVNANGVNLSANGGIAASDASGGNDNAAGQGGSAGNGGSAHSSADGGIVIVDELVTGNNRGNEVTVGDQAFGGDCGHGVIDGGDVTTTTNITISADGGVALADASGGDGNTAIGDGANAGNGGRARASADGGIVLVGSIITGNNQGNSIGVGDSTGSDSGGSGGTGGNGCLGTGSSINGGSMVNETNVDISADGGQALADASGGDDNLALGDDANAGNGGRARADANGGLIMVDSIISGYNQGNSIAVECGGSGGGGGATTINGGTISNVTNVNLNADGGTAIADASGGNDNVAIGGGTGSGNGTASAGNGGRSISNANGGVIDVGQIVSGYNVGNVISVGSSNAAPVKDQSKPKTPRTIKPKTGGPTAGPSSPAKNVGGKTAKGTKAGAGRATQSVGKLPDTGTGMVAGSVSLAWASILAALSALIALVVSQNVQRLEVIREFVVGRHER